MPISPSVESDLRSLLGQVNEFKTNHTDRLDRLQRQVDSIDAKTQDGGAREYGTVGNDVANRIVKNEELKSWIDSQGWLTKKHLRIAVPDGSFFGERKASTISDSALGSGSSGVMMPTRDGQLIKLPRRSLRIRDLLPSRPMTTGSTVDYLKQNSFTNAASPVAESATKPQSDLTYTTMSTSARTIAHWFQITLQALADVPGLREDLDSMGIYGLKLKEEDELLVGSGTGQHLNGLYTQATSYDTGLNVSGDTRLDQLRHAIYQVELAQREATGIVMHPFDLHKIDLLKTEEGGTNKGVYIIGDPRTGVTARTIWSLPVVSSMAMTSGTFLVGDFAGGAMIWDRMNATVDVSYENEDNFVTNEATIRFEERIALAVTMPDAFVKGTFV